MVLIIISNFLANPSFEEWSGGNIDSWFISGSGLSITQESDTIYKGNYSAKVTLTDTSTLWLYQRLPGKPDSLYCFTFFIFDNDIAGRVRWSLKFFLSSGGTQTIYGGVYTTNKPFWQYLSTDTIRAPSNADSLEVQIRFYDSSAVWDGDAEFFIDNSYLCYPSQDTPNVVINEIHYNPATSQGQDAYFEFVEVFNPSFEDTINTTQFQFTDGDGSIFRFPAIEIPPNEFIVIASNLDSISLEGEYTDDIINGNDQLLGSWGSIALGNTGDEVVLKNFDGVTLDSVSYGVSSPWPTSPNGGGPSLELIDWTADNNNSANWGASSETYGTPGEPNTIANPAPTIGKILRFPYIPYANQPDTIKSRIVDNNSVSSAKFFFWLLNSNLDSLTMTQGLNDTFYCILSGKTNGTRLDSFFIKAVDNESKTSYSDTTLGFFWGIMNIGDIRVNDANGSPYYRGYDVRLQGKVTAAESVFAVNYLLFYIQDGTGGIACQDPDPSKIQPIHENDSLEVIGTIVNFAGETQIKYVGDYITYLGEGNQIISETLSIAQMGENYEGKLVTIENVDTAYHSPWQSGVNTLDTIVDFSKAIGLIWIDMDTDIDGWGPSWTPNKNITGILRQYDISSPYTSGYEIAPRRQTDFSDYLSTFNLNLFGYSELDYIFLFWYSPKVDFFELYLKDDKEFYKIKEIEGDKRNLKIGPFDDGKYNFYIKGIKDGLSFSSNVVEIEVVNLKEGLYNLNTEKNLKFTYVAHKEKMIDVKIIDISGRAYYNARIQVKKGRNFVSIEEGHIKNGINFLYISDGKNTFIKKFLKIL